MSNTYLRECDECGEPMAEEVGCEACAEDETRPDPCGACRITRAMLGTDCLPCQEAREGGSDETCLQSGGDFYLEPGTSCWVRMGDKVVLLSRRSGTVRLYHTGRELEDELACIDLEGGSDE
jgi:hypothetical protein